MRASVACILLSIVITSSSTLHGQTSDDAIAARLDRALGSLFELGMSPGMVVSVVEGDRILYTRGFGLADLRTGRKVTPETSFYIASTTKSLTGFACALLAYEGKLDFTLPVTDYVPDLKFHPDIDPSTITLERLLTHTHGIDGSGPVTFRTAYTGDYTHAQLLALTARHGPAESGTGYAYSNIGYNIAGFVLEAVTGSSWKEAVDSLVCRPLKMSNTTAYVSRLDPDRTAIGYRTTPEHHEVAYPKKRDATMHAAGGHYTTAPDMASWIEMMMNKGKWNGEQIFPAAVVADVQRKHVDQDRSFGDIHRYGWGIGWDLGTYGEDTLIHRFGSYAGFRSHVSFMPSRMKGVVVLVNDGALGFALADGAAFTIYNILKGSEAGMAANEEILGKFTHMVPKLRERIAADLKRRLERDQSLPYRLSAYEGTYRSEAYGTMSVRPEDDRLVFRIGGLMSISEVYNGDENAFRVELTGGGTVARFVMEDGKATKLTIRGMEFTRVK